MRARVANRLRKKNLDDGVGVFGRKKNVVKKKIRG
jgi:hypothetical protein